MNKDGIGNASGERELFETSGTQPSKRADKGELRPLKAERGEDGRLTFVQQGSEDLAEVLAATTGTQDLTLGARLFGQTWAAGGGGIDDDTIITNSVSAALLGIHPEDEVEGMLAVQMVAVHNQAMEFLRLISANRSNLNFCERLANTANKLLRTYAMQMEALTRYRKKGGQTVTVEHVHVHQGGQAIVGNVTGRGE